MFDTVLGLPLHPLVIHAVVVLGPLTGLLLLGYVAVPRWRRGLRWPTVAMAGVVAAAAFVATRSGEALERRVGSPAFGHEAAGELAARSVWALGIVTLLVVFVLIRPHSGKGHRAQGARAGRAGVTSVVGIALTVAAVGFAGYAVFSAGHSGAESVWLGRIAGT